MATDVHPSAVVDSSAELAAGVVVGPFAVVGSGVKLGEGTEVRAHACVEANTSLGRENVVYPYAAVGFDPQDLKYAGESTYLEVGDRNQFREHSSIHRGTEFGGGTTRIGSDNLFMAFSHVGHDSQVGSGTVFVNGGTLGGHCKVGDDATIGAYSSVHPFCRVGAHAYIGGYSVITMDALPFARTVGQKPVCIGLNRIGLERKGVSEEAIRALEAALRVLLRSRLNTAQALEALRADHTDYPETRELIEFIVAAKRGIIKARRRGSRGGGTEAAAE